MSKLTPEELKDLRDKWVAGCYKHVIGPLFEHIDALEVENEELQKERKQIITGDIEAH